MIPKVIHLCWLSGDAYPAEIARCIESWKRILPDYEIMLWDTERFPLSRSQWVREAFEKKKYAFAADYIRFYALYHYGGIYLDSDVEVLRRFDDLLDLPYFVGAEKSGTPEAAIIGAEAGCDWVKQCLDYYDGRTFIKSDGTLAIRKLPEIMAEQIVKLKPLRVLTAEESRNIRQMDMQSEVLVMSDEYFSPMLFDSRTVKVTPLTYTIHHYQNTWFSPKAKLYYRTRTYFIRLLSYDFVRRAEKLLMPWKFAHLVLIFLLNVFLSPDIAAAQSVAGLFPLEGSGRVVYDFNEGWRFLLGDAEGAASTDYDDSAWPVVSAPHSVELVPAEASGGRNYQGVCWYRKHFCVPQDMEGKLVRVHFEAIMGKQQVYVNGRLAKEHLGGYLPITIDLSAAGVKAGDQCVIAVRADNSDDKTYPPGKKQSQLDFAYHGGMYRDVWLMGLSPCHITDPLERGQVAGGGVFLHYDRVSEKSADVYIDVEVANSLAVRGGGAVPAVVTAIIKDAEGKPVRTLRQKLVLRDGEYKTARLSTTINNPHLWSPESPYLYTVELKVTSPSHNDFSHQRVKSSVGGELSDGGIVRAGIRLAEFRGTDGFWLNGRPYHQLIGGNRHQDFAYVGNALPNSQQWRDALRLKEAGMDIVRAAHYPQDPAFMDACDELGLFVIVPTPGWQYWNKEPQWGELVHQNTRDIIRRDRNHPCVLLWEPILNETRYPEDFALKALQITREEFPFPGRPGAAADLNSAGVKENYDVLYDWADNIPITRTAQEESYANGKCVFTREWGEYVDDWYAHNAINRAARAWGEHAMLTAALSLADTYGMMYRGQRQFIGGCQWHPFDHQRGYHPDAYFGGIYDAFRQKKYAFEMFRSQIPHQLSPDVHHLFIAHEMTQFSPQDVTVFSNCDSVRLTALDGWKTATLPVVHHADGTPNEPVVFKGFWDFWKAREQSYTRRSWQNVKLVAEGIVGGEVVCTETKMPSRRSTKLRLYADELGRQLVADGSDFIVVVAEVTDDNGNVRRLARESITFSVEGEGCIIGDASIGANPRLVEWGSAPVLVRSTHRAGKITIIARPTYTGTHAPQADTLVIESVPTQLPQCFSEQSSLVNVSGPLNGNNVGNQPLPAMTEEERRRSLEEVERQQQEFGIQ